VCGPLTGGPRTARTQRSPTEPSISEEGKCLFPPPSTGAPHHSCGLLKEEPRTARGGGTVCFAPVVPWAKAGPDSPYADGFCAILVIIFLIREVLVLTLTCIVTEFYVSPHSLQ
jgi:hypothetical protein